MRDATKRPSLMDDATAFDAVIGHLEAAPVALDQALRQARFRVSRHRVARADARRHALGERAAALSASVAASVRAALTAPAAAGEEAPLFLESMHARADAALAVAERGNTVAGWIRAASGRLYRGWGAAVLRCLSWLLGVPVGATSAPRA